jgi:PKD repeat protein
VLAALLLVPTVQARLQTSEAYIIVHALNPEGMEIGSLAGPTSVEIFDGEHRIGYGAYSEETFNQPITVSPGLHTITVEFNGAGLSTDIEVESGETRALVFVFDREEIDAPALMTDSRSDAWQRTWAGVCPTTWGFNMAAPDEQNPVLRAWYGCYKYRDTTATLEGDGHFRFSPTEAVSEISVLATIQVDHPEEPGGVSRVEGNYNWNNPVSIPPSPVYHEWFVQNTVSSLYQEGTPAGLASLRGTGPHHVNLVDYVPLMTNRFSTRRTSATVAYDRVWFGWFWLGYLFQSGPLSSPGPYSESQRVEAVVLGENVRMSTVPYDVAGIGIRYEDIQPPTALFTHSPAHPDVDETITFDASPSHDVDGEIVSYAWYFGDGSSGDGEVVTHSYDEPGTYGITLYVKDNDDLAGSVRETVSVTETFAPPIAAFDHWRESPQIDETVTFDAFSSEDPDGYITAYRWDFGDELAVGEVVTHSFAATGDYPVSLTVEDDDGLTASITKTIEVRAIPVLLVHGYFSEADVWGPGYGPADFKQALIDEGFTVDTIDLVPKPANDSIGRYAGQLSSKLASLRQHDGDWVDVIAHSMGGLVTREYARQNPSRHDIRRLVMLGTPNDGSVLLEERYWFIARRVFDFFGIPIGPGVFLGQAAYDMTPGSPFLRTLAESEPLMGIIAYHAVAGDDPGPEYRLLKRLLFGESDGVVQVDSVHAIPGSWHYLYHVNHSGYDDEPGVFDTVVGILRGDVQASAAGLSIPTGHQPYQESVLFEDSVSMGETNDHEIPVDSTVSEVRFVLGSRGEELSLTLTSPGSLHITPEVAASDPSMTYTRVTTGLLGYSISGPEPGAWTAHVSISGTASADVEYGLLPFLDSDLRLTAPKGQVCQAGTRVPITAQLVYASDPITDAVVTALVSSPDDTTQMMSLFDDGTHGDGQPGDGEYTNEYTDTVIAGVYQATIRASGTFSSEQFVREAGTMLWMERKIHLPLIVRNVP